MSHRPDHNPGRGGGGAKGPVADDEINLFSVQKDTYVSTWVGTLLNGDVGANRKDVLLVTSVQNFVGGTAVLDGGSVSFTPNADFVGTASYEYVVTNKRGQTDIGLVQFEVTAPPSDLTHYSGVLTNGGSFSGGVQGDTANDPSDPSLDHADYYSFYATAGQIVELKVIRTEAGSDPYLSVFAGYRDPSSFGDYIDNSDEGFLFTADDQLDPPAEIGGDYGDPYLQFTAPYTGYYTAIVTNYGDLNTSSYEGPGENGLYDYNIFLDFISIT